MLIVSTYTYCGESCICILEVSVIVSFIISRH